MTQVQPVNWDEAKHKKLEIISDLCAEHPKIFEQEFVEKPNGEVAVNLKVRDKVGPYDRECYTGYANYLLSKV